MWVCPIQEWNSMFGWRIARCCKVKGMAYCLAIRRQRWSFRCWKRMQIIMISLSFYKKAHLTGVVHHLTYTVICFFNSSTVQISIWMQKLWMWSAHYYPMNGMQVWICHYNSTCLWHAQTLCQSPFLQWHVTTAVLLCWSYVDSVVGLPPGWVDPSVVYQHLDPPQPGGTWGPWGLLRWSGGWNGALMTEWGSCLLSAHAMCPRKWSWLLEIREETGGQPVVFLHWPWLHIWCMGSEGFYRVTTCQKHLTWQVFLTVPSFGPIHQHPGEI